MTQEKKFFNLLLYNLRSADVIMSLQFHFGIMTYFGMNNQFKFVPIANFYGFIVHATFEKMESMFPDDVAIIKA